MRFGFFTLLLWIGAGCGPTATPPSPVLPAPAPLTPPATDPVPPPGEPAPPPPPVEPEPPVTGTLDGQPFTPDVSLEGNRLLFRTEGPPERLVGITLSESTTKITVTAADEPGERVPEIDLPPTPGAAAEAPGRLFVNGYTLTLELNPVAAGRRTGRIELTLPGEPVTAFRGVFTAPVSREVGAPPTAADAPFVAGPLTRPKPGGPVEVGYLALVNGEVLFDRVTGLDGDGITAVRAETNPPRAAGLERGPAGERYEFTHLVPGRYLVFARTPDGKTAAWRYVDVAADAQLTEALNLDPAAMGSLTVKLPADTTGPVTLLPADDAPGDPLPAVALGEALRYQATPQNGTATFASVAAGSYRVVVAKEVKAVTVTAGQPATLDWAGAAGTSP